MYLASMDPTPPIIRTARSSDLPGIHALVVELAIYEREPDAVQASPDTYLQDHNSNWFQAVVAEYQGQLIGAAVFYPAYSTWKGKMIYLEDLIVTATWRQNGIGTQLFQAVIDHARQQHARLIKWQVLSWNEPALAFYSGWDARIEADWWNGKIHLL